MNGGFGTAGHRVNRIPHLQCACRLFVCALTIEAICVILGFGLEAEPMKQENEADILLLARVHLYRWFQTLLGFAPSAANMQWIGSELSLETVALFVENDRSGAGEILGKISAALSIDDASFLEALKSDYQKLFIGPEKLPLYHWESVYIKRNPALFNASTVAVRQAYLQEGMLPRDYPNEADDHIAIELDFMRLLGEEMRNGFTNLDKRAYHHALTSSAAFLDEHLLRWSGEYASRAKDIAEEYLVYPDVIQLLHSALLSDRAVLNELKFAI